MSVSSLFLSTLKAVSMLQRLRPACTYFISSGNFREVSFSLCTAIEENTQIEDGKGGEVVSCGNIFIFITKKLHLPPEQQIF